MTSKEFRALLSRRFNLPKEHSARRVVRSFSATEKVFFYLFVSIFIVSSLSLAWRASSAHLVEIPTEGGTLVEGVIGNPRFINPVLAISEADKNLVMLVYSGLVRITPEGGIANDLAEEITVSEDRLTYTAHLRENARFHDGTPITADDVVFTVSKILDPLIKSPKRGSFDGVAVEKLDERTVTFTLKQPYTPFIYNLSIGILPRHIWKNVTDDEFSFSQWNTLPIGSGPYKVEKAERNSGGIPDYYKLSLFRNAAGDTPFIKGLVFRFYPNEAALISAYNSREVTSVSGISPERISDLRTNGSRVISSPLPRVFGVFFNQTQSPALADKAVRQALDLASPKTEIVEKVFGGHATPINSPLPAGIYPWTSGDENASTTEQKVTLAKEILANAGWRPNSETGVLEKTSGSATISLSFSISTGDAPELRAVADELVASWRELGAEIGVLAFETGDLNQNVIRPRNFDALLFGEVVGRDADLYPFWHSSQKTDPGLNIALYTNTRADKFLEDARSATNPEEIENHHRAFAEELKADVPAVFLYTPGFLYLVPDKIESINLGPLSVSQDRFLGIRDWYMEKDKVWNIFVVN